jgi:NodT family efflux transporter outer membrane factor (OMF) lipoprotein
MAKQNKAARSWSGGLLLGAAAIDLFGCTVGPDFHAPMAPRAPGYSAEGAPTELTATPGVAGGQGQHFVPGRAIEADWWRAFGSADLDALVQEALKANADMQSMEAALRQAQALLAAQRGAQLPAVDLGYQAQQAKNSATLAPPLADNSSSYSLHTAQVTVSYAIDVFGSLRRQTEVAKAQTDAARFQYEAARIALVANVLAAAFQEAALAKQVEAAREQAEAARRILAVMQKQAELGQIGQVDVAAQQALVAQADQAAPALQKSLDQQRSALAILLGREPGQGSPAPLDFDQIVLPPDLPVVLPADLIRRRPDIEAAEANLHAASAQVGVAVAARLPNIALGVTAGGASGQLRDLLASDNSFWALTAGFTQPIFEGGALAQKQKAAQAAFDQAKAQYRSTVLGALKNVADSLDALMRDAEALKGAAAANDASRRSLAFARNAQQLGQTGVVEVLNAEQADAQSRAALIVAGAARYADTAALFQALGGGA